MADTSKGFAEAVATAQAEAASANPEATPAPTGTPDPAVATPTPENDAALRASKAEAELAKWDALKRFEKIGGPEQIARILEDVVALTSRPDFRAYQAGELRPAPEKPEIEDEFLTQEQIEIRDLKQQLNRFENTSGQARGALNGELAALRFERAEAQLKEKFGALWEAQRGPIQAEITRLAKSGAVTNLDMIDATLLHKAFVSSYATPQAFDEAMQKHYLAEDAKKRAFLQGKSTTSPTTLSPTASPTTPAKSVFEAFQRGIADLERGAGVTH